MEQRRAACARGGSKNVFCFHRSVVGVSLQYLVIASSMALVSAWPRCNVPVTLGGGITIVNLSALKEAGSVAVRLTHFLLSYYSLNLFVLP